MAVCQHRAMSRVVRSVREGKTGRFDAPELASGYRSPHPVHEMLADRGDSPGNVLVSERA